MSGARLVAILALIGSTGCAGLFRSYDVAPNGLRRDDDRLRQLVAAGRADSALARLIDGDAGDGDQLLRLVQAGVAAYQHGNDTTAATLLDAAAALSEERETRSVSKAALSLVSSDLRLPWQLSTTERLLVPYYAALARIRAGDDDGAAVEARRLSTLLDRYARHDVEDGVHALLRRFAGSVFEATERTNDARVAYRHAALLSDDSPAGPPPDTAAVGTGIPSGFGDVLVVIEHGFVPHRVEQSVFLYLPGSEVRALAAGETDERLLIAGIIAARVLTHAVDPYDGLYRGRPHALHVPLPERSVVEHRDCPKQANGGEHEERIGTPAEAAPDSGTTHAHDCDDERDENPYLMKIAWPELRASGRAPAAAHVLVDSARVGPAPFIDLSRSVAQDLRDRRAALLARTVARAATKLAVTRAAEKEIGDKDETAGRIVGVITNAGTALLERADTRSWHLLPQGIGIVRLRLPAGTRELAVELDGGRRIDFGSVTVPEGRLTFVTGRAF